jgi:hypothetical protein
MFSSLASYSMLGTTNHGGHEQTMNPTDTLPYLVRSFVNDKESAAELLSEFMRHVAKVARPYPAAYFVLGQKNGESVDDLGNRSFTSCSVVEKGRFPFSGRTPFTSFIEEDFDGRTIRYHSFYAKLAITREILRDDYAFNLRRDPVLRWRAELYGDIGSVLKANCSPIEQGRGVPPKWQLEGPGLRMLQPLAVAEAKLHRETDRSVENLVRKALTVAGPLTQSRLTNMLEAVIGAPASDEPEHGYVEDHTPDRMGLREAVASAWSELEDNDRGLIIGLAKGASYNELTAINPALKNKVAVSRAVSRVGQIFMDSVVAAVGSDAAPNVTPRSLMEPIMAMLHELFPTDFS